MSDKNRPKVGIACFIWKDGKFLIYKRLAEHGKGTWSIPGGHLENGEGWAETAARETAEESGVNTSDFKFLAITNDIFKSGKHYVTIWMEAKWESGEPQILEPDKCVDFKWVDFKTLPSPLFEPCWQNLKLAKPELFT